MNHTQSIDRRKIEAWVRAKVAAKVAHQAMVTKGVPKEFRHPRIQWRAGQPPATQALPPPRPVPANERERQQQYGGCYAMCEIIFASVNNSVLAELSTHDGDAG